MWLSGRWSRLTACRIQVCINSCRNFMTYSYIRIVSKATFRIYELRPKLKFLLSQIMFAMISRWSIFCKIVIQADQTRVGGKTAIFAWKKSKVISLQENRINRITALFPLQWELTKFWLIWTLQYFFQFLLLTHLSLILLSYLESF